LGVRFTHSESPMQLTSYFVVDVAVDGSVIVDQFSASNDAAAGRRACFASQGCAVELWTGERLVGRWVRSKARTFVRSTAGPAVRRAMA
jgi:hypothetical protein